MEEKTIKGNLEKLKEQIKKAAGKFFEELDKKYREQKDRLVFETETIYGDTVDEQEISELLANFEKDILKELLIIKMKELHRAEDDKNESKIKTLLKECQEITNKLSLIKN